MKKTIITLTLILLTSCVLFAQDEALYLSEIQGIDDLLKDASEYYDDADKLEANDEVILLMKELLEQPNSKNAAWDSLQRISVLSSPDERLKIFTWNILFDDLSHKCFGFIQYTPDKGKSYVYQLMDFFQLNEEMERRYRSHAEWYGVIYYDIIERPLNRKENVYTLLGWRGNNALTQQKVIETLEFDRNHFPVFGNNRMRVEREKLGRIVFNYSVRTNMILRFNEKQDFIVADHLAPSDPKLSGHFEYYGPDYSYDAFEYEGGKWYFVSDIDPDTAINFERDPAIEQIRERKPSTNF